MLRGDTRNELVQDNNQNENDFVFNVKNEPVMKIAVNLIRHFGKSKKIVLRAKGNSIPNAVAIANILTEKMLKGFSKIQKITVDSEMPQVMGRMISTIEIIISKN